MQARAIERISKPSVQEFRERYLRRNQPVVISGMMEPWKALSEWSVPYLRNRIGEVPAYFARSSESGIYRQDPNKGLPPATTMRMAEFFDYLESGPPGTQRISLMETPIPHVFPNLMEDIQVPPFAERTPDAINLWMGQAGNVTSLHYDAYENLLTQVRGRKQVTLYAPSDWSKLYPYSSLTRAPHCFNVDLEAPDYERFPTLREAQPFVAEIGPGDMLFIPFTWSHHVKTLEDGISVNFWWHASFQQKTSPLFLRLLVQLARLVGGDMIRRVREKKPQERSAA
jgi:lysine-specific demethylase 8